MTHEAFSSAGAGPGVEIWTIEKFEPVPVDENKYGMFYNGDSYIVLKTTGDSNSTLYYNAHFWLGTKSTQDKQGSAAIWTITLDDMLGGKAVHHREVQGHETSLFLGYFKPAIRYLEGGNESGFTEVQTNAGAEKRLLKLSGCDNMRIEEMPAEASSLTKEHCFILEVEHDIFVLMPEGAKATQRRKIISIANKLRDDDHNGRATIHIIDEFSADDDFVMFFEALGSGSRDELASDDSSETYSREDMQAVYLYRVLIGNDLDLVAISKPYRQSQLSPSEVYILDTPCSGVYVWLGSALDSDVRKNYQELAMQYLDVKGYPAWVNITRLAEGAESSTFKQYFHDWETVSGVGARAFLSDIDAGYFSSDVEESAETAKLIGKSAAARGLMPDKGDGSLVITRIAGEEEDITESVLSGLPVLYCSMVYVLKYQYTDSSGDDAYVLYYWVGAEASSSDKEAAAALVFSMEEELAPNVTLVKIPQGKETLHFLSIFKGNLVIVFGSKDNDYQRENVNGTYADDNIRLFKVEGTEVGVDMRAVQVAENSSELRPDLVFVLETAGDVLLWRGKESSSQEQQAALDFVKLALGEEREVITVDEGEEPQLFWDALGGEPEEKADASSWRVTVNRRVTTPRTLTAVTVKISGKIVFEDLDEEFTQQALYAYVACVRGKNLRDVTLGSQRKTSVGYVSHDQHYAEDLSDDSVYILDTGEELYLWQGRNIPERVKLARHNIIKEYIEDDGLERTVESTIVAYVKQGAEPMVFRKLFPGDWDCDMWDNQTSYEDMKNQIKSSNSN